MDIQPAAACEKDGEEGGMTKKTINIALQGGGAHGAYSWGVLDRLLEDGRLHFSALTATSAGAMNAAAFASGYVLGGADGARETLEEFWRRVAEAGAWFKPSRHFPFNHLANWLDGDNWLTYSVLETFSRNVSPYDFNPFNFHPLRDVLEDVVDFEAIKNCTQTKLFISATAVESGQVRVFRTPEITTDVILASACLPYLFQAVEIDGAHYWDGGYIGNPALWPLFYEVDCRDLLVIQINPMHREQTPHRASEILNRINEISFNSSLLKEMRAIAFVQRLLREGWIKDEYRDRLKDILFHAIRADRYLKDLSIASKFNADWRFFIELRDRGREAASHWLAAHYDDVGRRDSVDLTKEFLEPA